MGDKISDSSISVFNNLVKSGQLSDYEPEIQAQIISGISTNAASESDGGKMGEFFGNKKENAAMHIALTICVLLVLVGIVGAITGKDYWNVIIPALTTGMGYIFGKSEK